jgi:hypothetical protein
MCCFSPIPIGPLGRLFGRKPQLHVSVTQLFARLADGVQWLAYSMLLATPSDVAMVLPLPVARDAEDALELIDLSACPEFFEQLGELFPEHETDMESREIGLAGSLQLQTLVVHDVGSFEASYVPRLRDMDRLDKRFRVPEEIWQSRKDYADFGFAVFKLKKGKKRIHPMAMRFGTAEPSTLFFPTLHVHDGQLHPKAMFDHTLYYEIAPKQSATAHGPDGRAIGVGEATIPIEHKVSIPLTHGVAVPGGRVFRFELAGELPNADVRIHLPAV